jgi:hypothetical protein
MRTTIYAALFVGGVLVTPLAASAQEGPRPSSQGNVPGMMQDNPPAYGSSVTPFDGSRPSSLGNWPEMSGGNTAGESSANPIFQGPRPGPRH